MHNRLSSLRNSNVVKTNRSCSRSQIREYEPRLSKDVIGGWWFTDDASVDARLLTDVLRTCCEGNGVEFINGDVTGIVGEEKVRKWEDERTARSEATRFAIFTSNSSSLRSSAPRYASS